MHVSTEVLEKLTRYDPCDTQLYVSVFKRRDGGLYLYKKFTRPYVQIRKWSPKTSYFQSCPIQLRNFQKYAIVPLPRTNSDPPKGWW